MRYQVYIYEGSTQNEEFSHSLAMDAVDSYCSIKGIEFDRENANIMVGPTGKPFIDICPISFNISHSGILWVCMVGEKPCGIDIQVSSDMDVKRYE